VHVSDVMTPASITDSPSDTLRSAATNMWREQTGSLVVMDGDSLVGMITERDILRAVARGIDLDRTMVGEVMTKNVVTVEATELIRNAARIMAKHWIRHLPVLHDGQLVGVLSQRDVVGVFAALWRESGAVEIEADALVRTQRLARIEHGDLD
jgi:CBS domain-containing protein